MLENPVFSPARLPCGRNLRNRLVKVALYEHLGNFQGGPANAYHVGLYSEWAKHPWGMIITGNVQVSPRHLTLGRDMVVPSILDTETVKPFKVLVDAIHGAAHQDSEQDGEALAIMQLSHAGRQSPNIAGGRSLGVPPLAPSALRVGSSRVGSKTTSASMVYNGLFQVPREMTIEDINTVKQEFVRGALLAARSGFDGIQLHVAHGYLLSEFVDPKTNFRQDDYSADHENALRLLEEIVHEIRLAVPSDFIVGVKINSADYVGSGTLPEAVLEEDRRVLNHVRTIASWAIDFIEISGGDYVKPEFMSNASTSSRQAFFAHFSQKVMRELKSEPKTVSPLPLILLTGGLRSPALLESAIRAEHADLLGIGRSAILCPDIPTRLQKVSNSDYDYDREFAAGPPSQSKVWLPRIPLIGAGVELAWYTVRMRNVATSQMPKKPASSKTGLSPSCPPIDYKLGALRALLTMWIWST
ncbi:hypothetical protein BJ138DRAFT_1016205 [Hygrophoropsis aurantiaca]|uniref:Uncharacterized protein n=1 Tax=Hygrophoropsis aurantiaca TaxID=72124 RepID=A0ACB7ZZ66_9AGAM|nr:hypothetical protein BJ138DRAFT_1016205 [Hygrophoropsis aurantiaca]